MDYLKRDKKYYKYSTFKKKKILFLQNIKLQALIYGTDFILLIAKSLSQDKLNELYSYARGLNLEVLVGNSRFWGFD